MKHSTDRGWSGQTFLAIAGRVGSGQRFAESGPRKVTRGQLCSILSSLYPYILASFFQLPNLKNFSTHKNKDLTDDVLTKLSNLTSLDVRWCSNITHHGISAIAANNPRLEVLHIQGIRIDDFGELSSDLAMFVRVSACSVSVKLQ